MRKLAAAIIMIMALTLAVNAIAEDTIINSKVERVTTKTTRTGDSYAMVFVQEDRTLDGIGYSVAVPVYAFGATSAEVAALQPGDTFKAIVSKRESRGREPSYTLHKVLK